MPWFKPERTQIPSETTLSFLETGQAMGLVLHLNVCNKPNREYWPMSDARSNDVSLMVLSPIIVYEPDI